MEDLSEEERKALRGSKFAPLPPPPSRSNQSRLAHPGGPLKTNKAAALAKFLERKLQEPNGLASIDPDLVEMAVKNAKSTVSSAGASTSGRVVRHVSSFGDSVEDSSQEGDAGKKKKRKRNKEKKKKKGAKNVNQGSFGEGGGEGSNLQNKGKKEKKKKKKQKN
ncbi:unnamed protein product [Linum tenue]|uniref:Uncharacterized protein n=1 Tax=Linum tenue TaxID=586396 RepID=A0AAV0P813_9ROSI|nr:unnamed protein product [Linum tenue]